MGVLYIELLISEELLPPSIKIGYSRILCDTVTMNSIDFLLLNSTTDLLIVLMTC